MLGGLSRPDLVRTSGIAEEYRTLFHAPEITHILGILQSPWIKEDLEANEQLIVSAKRFLKEFVHAGGEPLYREALSLLERGTADESKRAQLILSQYKRHEETALKEFGASTSVELWGWAVFSSDDFKRRSGVTSNKALYESSSDDEPFIAVSDAVGRQLRIPDHELQEMKEEFVKGYHLSTSVRAVAHKR